MRFGAALLGAVAFFALTTPAEAKRFTAWYFGVDGGASFVDDIDVSTYVDGGAPPVASAVTTEMGYSGFVTAGYAFQNNWRVELEGGYRVNDFDTITPSGGLEVPLDGDAKEFTLMANVLYDFESASDLLMSIGAGIGADYAKVNGLFPAPIGAFNDDELSLAFQAIAGFAYPITSWMDLTLNYRYLYVTELNFSDDSIAPLPHVDTDPVQKHAVTLGLRFGGRSKTMKPAMAAAAPPPPPPPAVARQYVIFFGFNKCNITADADGVLSEAASAARMLGSTTIKIVGHTDTVGKSSTNQILSECRANAAKINLAGKGIPAGAIIATGRGETQLLVQTPDQVKEPQNRRATVDL